MCPQSNHITYSRLPSLKFHELTLAKSKCSKEQNLLANNPLRRPQASSTHATSERFIICSWKPNNIASVSIKTNKLLLRLQCFTISIQFFTVPYSLMILPLIDSRHFLSCFAGPWVHIPKKRTNGLACGVLGTRNRILPKGDPLNEKDS